MKIPFQCPACAEAPLEVSGTAASCSQCQKTWSVEDGLLHLCRQPRETYPADELTPQQAAFLVARAEGVGWRDATVGALGALPQAEAAYLERYMVSVCRPLLIELLDLHDGDTLLDHGCGWGNVTCELARRANVVIAMDLIHHRVKFTEIRARQEGLVNVVPLVSGDYPHLPFPMGSIDKVVMIGALEWVPYVFEGPPQGIQEGRLKEALRILKPGGQLLLAIENRYWWRYLVGTPEVHTNVRWGTLVPRFMANLVARLQGLPNLRAYTYSLGGYHRLLHRCGFDQVAAYVTFPEYNFPVAIAPVRRRMALRHAATASKQGAIRVSLLRLAANLGVLPHLAYCFAFVCAKGEKQ